MTAYTTRDLAAALIDDADDNPKAAGRTLRKFLRAEAVSNGGAVGVDTPGKGGRYTIELNKRELTAMGKRFAKWAEAEEEAKAARAALKAELATKVPAPVEDADEAEDAYEGPSDDDIASLLEDDDEVDEL